MEVGKGAGGGLPQSSWAFMLLMVGYIDLPPPRNLLTFDRSLSQKGAGTASQDHKSHICPVPSDLVASWITFFKIGSFCGTLLCLHCPWKMGCLLERSADPIPVLLSTIFPPPPETSAPVELVSSHGHS